ncbi:MAG: matrixin family metalloprotease [Candidatus Falkowbacteria bacterium]
MKKLCLIILTAAVVLAIAGAANAGMLIPASEQAKEHAKAPEKSPVISETPSGEWDLERVDFIHYAKPVKPVKPVKTETCYKLLGVKWKNLPVSYVINPDNNDELAEEFITAAVSSSAETWDAASSVELFNGTYAIDESAQYGKQDYKNTIAFRGYPDDNVIGVTTIWFTRVGRQIVEFDILFNDAYVWGDASDNLKVMDLANIATHELGHGVGMDDIYSSSCSEVTMYGYSTEGEIEKRTLEQPDITGLRTMYGI